MGDREGGATGGVTTIASTPRQGRGVGPGISAILDDVKRRRTSTLVPRPRQALDGSPYGGTHPTDISRINRRCDWSHSCPAAGSHATRVGRDVVPRSRTIPGRLRGPLMGGRSARRPGRRVPHRDRDAVRQACQRQDTCVSCVTGLTNRSHINDANEPRAAATGSHRPSGASAPFTCWTARSQPESLRPPGVRE